VLPAPPHVWQRAPVFSEACLAQTAGLSLNLMTFGVGPWIFSPSVESGRGTLSRQICRRRSCFRFTRAQLRQTESNLDAHFHHDSCTGRRIENWKAANTRKHLRFALDQERPQKSRQLWGEDCASDHHSPRLNLLRGPASAHQIPWRALGPALFHCRQRFKKGRDV